MAKTEKKQEKKKGGFRFLDLLSGELMLNSFLYKQRWYLLFLLGISILYISAQYGIDATMRRSKRLREEREERRVEYVSKSTELMQISKRSEVVKLVKSRNLELEESRIPPKRLVED